MAEEREPDGFKIAAEQNQISARFTARAAAQAGKPASLLSFHRSMIAAAHNGVLETFTSAMHLTVQKSIVNWPDAAAGSSGETALMEAAACGHVEIVKHLLKIGADISQEDDEGRTALHRAAEQAKPVMVKLLLDNGADPNSRSIRGWTPLAEAANRGKAENAKLLLERGAQTRVAPPDDASIRALAVRRGHHAIADLIDAEEKKRGAAMAEKLVEKGTGETITVSRPLKLKPNA